MFRPKFPLVDATVQRGGIEDFLSEQDSVNNFTTLKSWLFLRTMRESFPYIEILK